MSPAGGVPAIATLRPSGVGTEGRYEIQILNSYGKQAEV